MRAALRLTWSVWACCLVASALPAQRVAANDVWQVVAEAQQQLQASELRDGVDSRAATQALLSLLGHIVDGYWHEGHAQDALNYATRAVRLTLRHYGADSQQHAQALQQLGLAYAAMFRHQAALQQFEKAAAIVQQATTSASPAQRAWATILHGRAVRNSRGDPSEAQRMLEAGLAEANHLSALQAAQGWLALASVLEMKHQYADADQALERAGMALKSMPNHPLQAEWLRYRAMMALNQADPAQALSLSQSAVDAAERAKPRSPSLHFITQYAYGQIEQRLDHLDTATQWFDRAGKVPEIDNLNGGYSLAMLRYSQCGNQLRRARNVEAEAVCRDAAERFDALPEPAFVEACVAWNNVGASLLQQGREADAIQPLQRALQLSQRAGPSYAMFTNSVIANLAAINMHRGSFAEAEALLQQRLVWLSGAGDFSPIDKRSTWNGLAASHWGMGRLDTAFDFAEQAERSAARVRRIAAADLDEQRALQLFERLVGGWDSMLAQALHSGDTRRIVRVWEAGMEAHGIESSMAARRLRLARAAMDPKLKSVWQDWQARNAALTQARLDAARAPSSDAEAALDAADLAFVEVDRQLAQISGGERAYLTHGPFSLGSVRQALPAHTSLVRFARLAFDRPQDFDRTVAPETSQIVALVAEPDQVPRIVLLGNEAELQNAVQRWYALASRPDSDAALRAKLATQLWQRLWQPLRLREKRVFIVPGLALLNRVNFLALQDSSGRYLLEQGIAVHALNHEQELLRAISNTKPSKLLLVGAPQLHTPAATETASNASLGDCAAQRSRELAALPGAARELDALAKLAGEAGIAHPVLQGADASEPASTRAMPSADILHFATHGFYLGAACSAATSNTRALHIAAAGDNSNRSELAALVMTAPDDDTRVQTADDGLLTSAEVATLDLSHADWAVLSACETALGADLSKEGVGGLRRAFFLAGVRSVIMSLWKVDDTATAEFMQSLYRQRLLKRVSTQQAMLDASAELLRARRTRGESDAPYYWAAFVATGDWR